MTIKTKIICAMTAMLALALLVGGVNMHSLHRIGSDVEVLYTDGLVPLVAVSNVQATVFKNRTAINHALLVFSSEETKSARAKVEENFKLIERDWSSYFPSHVDSEQERGAAQVFLRDSADVQRLIAKELTLMDEGRRQEAIDLMVTTLGPALGKEADSIDAIVRINEQQARGSHEDASSNQRSAVLASAVILLIGAVFVMIVGFLLVRAIMRPLLRARRMAERISEGELNHRLKVSGNDEISDLLRSLSVMDGQLTKIVASVRDNAANVARATQDISAGNDSLSQRTQEQAASLEETASSMEEMAATTKQNAEVALEVNQITDTLCKEAARGHVVAGTAVVAMEHIAQASRNVSEMAVLVDDIAFQTNLLSLNAAIEAARAKEHGRGFAVVATEVRNLAQRSASAAKDIKSILADCLEKVSEGTHLVGETGLALDGIKGATLRVTGLVAQVARASEEQSVGIEQVNNAVTLLDQVTQENAALVEEASAAARHTMEMASALTQQVAFFKLLPDGDAADSTTPPSKPVVKRGARRSTRADVAAEPA